MLPMLTCPTCGPSGTCFRNLTGIWLETLQPTAITLTTSLYGFGESVFMFGPVHWFCNSLKTEVLSEGQTNVPKSPLVVSDFGPIEEELTMGMDVYGREPSDEQGNYFRASVWSWLPLHEAMYRTCADVLDQELIKAMAFNDSAGPEDQETCNQIADRIEALLREKPGGIEVHATLRKTADGRLLSPEELEQLDPKVETLTPYRVTGEHLQEFIRFLRHCGGFVVC